MPADTVEIFPQFYEKTFVSAGTCIAITGKNNASWRNFLFAWCQLALSSCKKSSHLSNRQENQSTVKLKKPLKFPKFTKIFHFLSVPWKNFFFSKVKKIIKTKKNLKQFHNQCVYCWRVFRCVKWDQKKKEEFNNFV